MKNQTAYDALTTALDTVIPELAALYTNDRKGAFARHLENQDDLDPLIATEIPGALVLEDGAFPVTGGRTTTSARTRSEQIRRYAGRRGYRTLYSVVMHDLGEVLDVKRVEAYRGAYYAILNPEKLEAAAVKWATQAAHEWRNKMAAKLGDVDDVELRHLSISGEIVIIAHRAGREVRIAQQRVIKQAPVSGYLFAQWPARIRVNGKATTEADYRKMFEEVTA